MIKTIDLKNFQSHADTKIDFHPGVNVIVGASDCGKTAIIRSLNWLLTNRPLGESFRSRWGGGTMVAVKLKDCAVNREKSATTNKYFVGETQFSAIGSGVPPEVSEKLNLSTINAQFQMDAPFLLSGSAGEAARMINAAAGLDEIDTVLGRMNREAREAAAEEQRATEAVRLAAQEEARWRFAEPLEAELTKAEAAFKDVKASEDARFQLHRGVTLAQRAADEYKALPDVAALRAEYDAAVGVYVEMCDSVDRLSSMIDALEKLRGAATAELDTAGLLAALSEARACAASIEEEQDDMQSLRSLVVRLQRTWGDFENLNGEVARLAEAYKSIVPKTCPTCGQSWPEK